MPNIIIVFFFLLNNILIFGLLLKKRIGSTAYSVLYITILLVSVALFYSDRLSELDLKNLRMTLHEIKEAKEEIYAKEKDLKRIAAFLTDLITVDQSIGYAVASFEVRQLASPYLNAKAKKIREDLGFPNDDRLVIAVQKWVQSDNEKEKAKVWVEIEKIIKEILK